MRTRLFVASALSFGAAIAISAASVGVLAAPGPNAPPKTTPPQVGAGITVGLAGVAKEQRIWDETVFHLGARADVMFGRNGPNSFGVGPYVEVLTHDFGELQTGAGGSFLIPVHELFPIVISAGGYLRIPWQEDGPLADKSYGVEPGLAATLFLGTRSFNYHTPWEVTIGLIGQARFGLGDSHESSFVIAAQLDMSGLWIPWVFLIHAVQESSEATRIK